ncbi:hypothetical protein [Halpernia sp. GG3]
MIGDKINLTEKYIKTAKEIVNLLQEKPAFGKATKTAIGIGGESGCGKSVTAFAMHKVLRDKGIKSLVLQMDDYFHLPPQSNHENRLKDLANVGENEVNLNLLKGNVDDFKTGKSSSQKPLVNYKSNSISKENLNFEKIEILIVEGTYILDLDNFDHKIFIDRTYKDTFENRMTRDRDEKSDFIEQVLEIEHNIIRTYKDNADFILDKNYKILIP